jgi:hypothetical protein
MVMTIAAQLGILKTRGYKVSRYDMNTKMSEKSRLFQFYFFLQQFLNVGFHSYVECKRVLTQFMLL